MSNHIDGPLSRRSFLSAAGILGASALLSACTSFRPGLYGGGYAGGTSLAPQPQFLAEPELPSYAVMYAPVVDGGFDVPAAPFEQIDPQFLRQIVDNTTGQPPGTIVVDTSAHYLYYTRPSGQAIRYGVGLGRAGFEWAGQGVIQWKQPWPRWFPPEEMIAREPRLEQYRAVQVPGTNEWLGGQPGGPTNPLGARALYIYQDGKDTLYRLHGSPEWSSIGKSVSSGCVRMMHQDVMDLYDRVPAATPIVVTGAGATSGILVGFNS